MDAEKQRNQNQLCQSKEPTSLFEGNSFLVVKEVKEEALPLPNQISGRAAPDIAVQKNIDYIRNLTKMKADRERQQKEFQEKLQAE